MRLPDEDYYEELVAAHTAQGDVYGTLPFGHTTVVDEEFEARGRRPRPDDPGLHDVALVSFTSPGVLRILEVRLIQVVAPNLYEPADMDPDMSDSWAGSAE